MGKGGLFVIIYSVILIALFITFSYLMMTVNPPMIKEDTLPGNESGLDDILYADEVLLPSYEFQYGLERSPIEFRSDDINLTAFRSGLVEYNKYDFEENVNSNIRKVVPPVWPEESSTLTTRVTILTTFAKTSIPAKGLRRSINEKNNTTIMQNVPRSLLLKIINNEGQPRIEIKLASDDSVKKKTRKYRSSETILKPRIKSPLNNITAKHNVRIHDYKWSVIKMEENKTLFFNINDSFINLVNESRGQIHLDEMQTDFYDTVNNFNFLTSSETLRFGLLHKNMSDIGNTTANYSSNVISINGLQVIANIVNHSSERHHNESKLPKNISELQTQKPKVLEIKKAIGQIDNVAISELPKFKSTRDLLGLMIPEATATLPFKYNFIDENDKNVFSNVIKIKRRSNRD